MHSWGLNNWAASFLEAAGPLTTIGAQLIYISQPVLGTFIPQRDLEALAEMLEEPEQRRGFTRFLLGEIDS